MSDHRVDAATGSRLLGTESSRVAGDVAIHPIHVALFCNGARHAAILPGHSLQLIQAFASDFSREDLCW